MTHSHNLAPVHGYQEVRFTILSSHLLDAEEVLTCLEHHLGDDKPGLAVGLLPLSGSGTEHLHPLEPGQHHGQPVGVLDVGNVRPGVTKYLNNSRLEAQVEPNAFGAALLVAAAKA